MRRPCLRPVFLAIFSLLALLISGCDWLARPAGDPRRESNYQDGLQCLNQARWENARESFYRSLEVNPQNLLAHLALGDLYASHLTNQVSAHFHYTRYLEIGREQNRDFHDQSASDGIRNAEIEMARRFAETLFRDQQQHELDGLRRTNVVLLERIEVLNKQISLLNQRLVAPSNPPAIPSNRPPSAITGSVTGPVTGPGVIGRAPLPPVTRSPVPPTNHPGPVTPPTPVARTHRVEAGETLALIARRHGLKITALQAANPGVNPRTLRVGQSVIIPPP